MKLADVPPGTLVVTQETIGDDVNSTEIREVLYLREEGRECRYANNVPVARLAIAQGDPFSSAPRYFRVLAGPCRDPGEADGRIPVRFLEEAVWKGVLEPNK